MGTRYRFGYREHDGGPVRTRFFVQIRRVNARSSTVRARPLEASYACLKPKHADTPSRNTASPWWFAVGASAAAREPVPDQRIKRCTPAGSASCPRVLSWQGVEVPSRRGRAVCVDVGLRVGDPRRREYSPSARATRAAWRTACSICCECCRSERLSCRTLQVVVEPMGQSSNPSHDSGFRARGWLRPPLRPRGSGIPDRVGLYCGVLTWDCSGTGASVGRACVSRVVA